MMSLDPAGAGVKAGVKAIVYRSGLDPAGAASGMPGRRAGAVCRRRPMGYRSCRPGPPRIDSVWRLERNRVPFQAATKQN